MQSFHNHPILRIDHGPKGDLSTVIACHICRAQGPRADTWRAIIWRASDRPKPDRRRHGGVPWIVDVASAVAAVERRAVVAGQRQIAPEPFGQVGVGDKVTTERDEIRVGLPQQRPLHSHQ